MTSLTSFGERLLQRTSRGIGSLEPGSSQHTKLSPVSFEFSVIESNVVYRTCGVVGLRVSMVLERQ